MSLYMYGHYVDDTLHSYYMLQLLKADYCVP